MAPFSDLPPAPPIPEEELRPRRRPKPGKAGPAAAADSDETERSIVTVRSNRRLAWWAALTGWPLFLLVSALLIPYFSQRQLLIGPWMLSLGAGVMGLLLLMYRHPLTYDTRTGAIGAGSAEARAHLHNWQGGDRIEYSVPFAELRIVHPDGGHRGIVRNSFMLDRASWIAFVDIFLAQQNSRAEGLQGTGPSAEDRATAASEPAISVGVRWRLFIGPLLGGVVLTALALESMVNTETSVGILGVVAAGYVLFGGIPLLCNPALTYEPETGRLTVKNRGLPARELPRRGYERLEYSVYTAVLYEVRPDGRRRRVAARWTRDQDTWKTFVDRFTRDHPAAENRSTGGEER